MDQVERGKKMIICVIAICIFISVGIIISNLITGSYSGADVIPVLFRSIFEIVMCYFLYKGRNWARIVMLVLFIGGVAMTLFLAAYGGASMSIMTILYTICAVLLLNNCVKTYQRYIRTGKIDSQQ